MLYNSPMGVQMLPLKNKEEKWVITCTIAYSSYISCFTVFCKKVRLQDGWLGYLTPLECFKVWSTCWVRTVPLCMEVKQQIAWKGKKEQVLGLHKFMQWLSSFAMAYKACKGQPMESLTVNYIPRSACVIMCVTCGVLANRQRLLLGIELGKVVK